MLCLFFLSFFSCIPYLSLSLSESLIKILILCLHHILLNVVNYNFFLFKMSDSYSDSMDEDENAVRHDIHLFFTLIVTRVNNF